MELRHRLYRQAALEELNAPEREEELRDSIPRGSWILLSAQALILLGAAVALVRMGQLP